ncbi:MAG: hypothetical protein K2K92_07230 [Duncaniella sp.]|nr:hypothetical protein [Duncaniella sp.]
MNVPFITWCCIVGVVILIVALRLVKSSDYCVKAHHRMIERGTESEELFVPGDRFDDQAEYDE